MSNFHFRLERVLRWRRIEAAAEEDKLKRLIADEARIRESIADLQAQKLRLATEVSQYSDASGLDFNCASDYAARLARERDKAIQLQKSKQSEILKQMEAHRAARQKQKLLEELRGRRFAEWQQQTTRELDALADESYLSRWAPTAS